MQRVTVILFLSLFGQLSIFARPVAFPTLEELFASADLVAVIRPMVTTNASDQLTSAGPIFGPRNPSWYQAMNTRCEVLLVLKSSDNLGAWQPNELTILHFCYSDRVPEWNGGLFVYFYTSPMKLKLTVEGDSNPPDSIVGTDSMWKAGPVTYLAFLEQAPDGRFLAVTGHYDSELSFRILVTPSGGASRYAWTDEVEKRQKWANESVERTGAPPAGTEAP